MKTKLDYMNLCLHHWEWLEKYPTKDKRDYFEENPSIPKLTNQCAACEWTLDDDRSVNCAECFLNSYTWGDEEYACEYDLESPYRLWDSMSGKTDPEEVVAKKNAAHLMVEGIKKAISDELGNVG